MSLLSQFSDTATYHLHNMTYNPDAEKFAKDKKEKADAKAKKEVDDLKKQAKDDIAEVKADLSKKVKKTFAWLFTDSQFSYIRFFGRMFGTMGIVLIVFFTFVVGIFGASLATNLNVYRPMGFRILYALYGFFFFWIVIPYAVLWRWIWKGKQPRFYALIPIIPYFIENRFLAICFSWLSFKPDDQMEALREWHTYG